ncbi:unnamed protein product [Ostreobium quekettii]|uniref:SSD domain-containing protein n=1 Tax=Ostreobium quekettii TaxID=121088 RepID=A0A8S1J7I6_9CHLO|nr:unnamed protein product [Ostreobium quekettii]
MAIITAFGLAQLFKIKFNLVVQTLPFLLLGLGTDDTFVIVGAYHQTDAALPGEDRIAQAMRAAGSSILVTSVTDMVAFLMGSYTELPALRAFSAYATLGIIFDFFYQVTFFLACLALDTKREKRAYNGAPRWGFQCCCLGSWCGSDQYNEGQFVKAVLPESTKDLEKGQAEGLAAATVVAGDGKRDPNRKIFGAGSYDPSAPSFATKLVGEWIPKYTLSPVGKAIVIVAECGLLAMAIYGSTKVFMDFQFRDWFTPDGSWLKDAFEVEDRYFSGDSTAFEVYTKEPPADRPSYYHFQDDLVRLVDELRANDKFVTDNPPVSSWYESFCNSVEPGQMSCANSSQLTPDNFDFQVFQFINSNDSTEGRFFNGRVIFEPPVCSTADDCQIISSRIDGQSQDVVDGQFAVDLVDSLRDTAKAAIPDLDPIAYNPVFLFYDGFRVIAWETVRNVLMAGVAVFVMSLIVLSNFFAGLAVLAMVAATDVMLFGWMHYVDLQFNTVTAINMVLAVGIAVDYSAHITHSFLVVKGTRDERAKAALFRIGGEVLAGAFTTFLAVAVMGAAEHYIFQVFFKMFAAIIMFGIWHGVIVLPVMLSILGPVAYEDVAKQ